MSIYFSIFFAYLGYLSLKGETFSMGVTYLTRGDDGGGGVDGNNFSVLLPESANFWAVALNKSWLSLAESAEK